MPRKARELSITGIYHAMMRGINRQRIFEDRLDCVDIQERNRVLSAMLEQGVGIRQLQRLTGVGATIIHRNASQLKEKQKFSDVNADLPPFTLLHYRIKLNLTNHI
ncbi:MAG: Trp family transcriptional regulator [Bacteroidales bacterium]|nr:Trp family transcriptional regulator [Bacteroidales bacterium]